MGELALTKAVRGSILHFKNDPRLGSGSYEYLRDGILVHHRGLIERIGPASEVLPDLEPGLPVMHYKTSLIVPGFVDTHVHYPQTEMIASKGKNLLDWLNTYTFPVERKFKSYAHCRYAAQFFLQQLLSNGTTTALVFSTVHKVSAQALFEEALNLKMRLITGKVLMDRNAPEDLLDTAESGCRESTELIKEWHGRGRLGYAVTPRFAPTSTPEQLAGASYLLREFPGTYLHTHLSENQEEVDWVKELYPEAPHYLGVYEKHSMLGEHSVFAHAIHLSDTELDLLAESRSALAFCPTSNLFLGSGLFDIEAVTERGIRFGMATDVGAGTSFSILQSLNEAYKIAQLQQYTLDPLRAFYLATLGGAETLGLSRYIGNFEAGKEADFVVLNTALPRLLANRFDSSETLEEKLLILMTLGDDRNVEATYVMGRPLFERHRD
ncbi:MAG: guanine deaminase [Bdellovibrionaceae bacterium]|nr:guanine deaminase [Pseudobdellovibrionaceae bacterium]